MTPQQVLALLALLADLQIAVDRLSTENEQLRQALAERPPAEQ